MGIPSKGSVVVVPFPFSDLSQSKLRPAIILAEVGREDFILCQVTSNHYGDDKAVQLGDQSFSSGSLKRISFARPGKLFTGHSDLIISQVGILEPRILECLLEAVVAILRGGSAPFR